MSETALKQTLDLLQSLEAEELREVEEATRARLASLSEASALDEFHRALIAAGLVLEIKTPDPASAPETPLVSIRGAPLSRTIIEERR